MGTESVSSQVDLFFFPFRSIGNIDQSTMRSIVVAFRPLTFDNYEAQFKCRVRELLQEEAQGEEGGVLGFRIFKGLEKADQMGNERLSRQVEQ